MSIIHPVQPLYEEVLDVAVADSNNNNYTIIIQFIVNHTYTSPGAATAQGGTRFRRRRVQLGNNYYIITPIIDPVQPLHGAVLDVAARDIKISYKIII